MERELKGDGLRSFKNTIAEGQALVTDSPITFLGFVDHITGKIVQKDHPLYGLSIKDKILIFPRSSGSTVGPYVLLNIKSHNSAPKAILNRESDSITVSGCSVARIPLAYRFDSDPTAITNGALVRLHLRNGTAIVKITEKE